MAVRACSILVPIRSEAKNPNGSAPSPASPLPIFPRLNIKKPSWIIRTESNVRRAVKKKPKPPCVVCKGSGKVNCHDCNGEGRTNCIQSVMLPKGEWPKWCRTCRGSGLGYCSRCLGTGKYTRRIRFDFVSSDADDS